MATTATAYKFVDATSHFAASGLSSRPTSKARSHICEICNKNFKRSEHLSRHVRAHYQEKPFRCRYCPKDFARKDLLTRHEKSLHSPEYSTVNNHSHRGMQNLTQQDEGRPSGGNPTGNIGDDETLANGIHQQQTDTSPEMKSPGPIAAGMAEPSMNVYVSQEDILPLIQSPSLPEEFPNVFTEQIIPVSDQTSAMEQNLAASNNLLERYQDQIPPLSIPTGTENPEDFAMLDESFFDQVEFPIEIIDLNFSPQPLPFDNNTSSANFDTTTSLGEDLLQHAVDTSLESNFKPLPDNRSSSHQQPTHRRVSRLRQPAIDELAKEILMNDLRDNYKVDAEQLRNLPGSRSLDNFLRKFLRCFQRHLPIFHVPTFNTMITPAPLLLAMCSIGALYTLDRKQAHALRLMASNALSVVQTPKYTGHHANLEPIWQTQCRLLIVSGAMFGGNMGDASDGMSESGCFVRTYTLRRSKLSTKMVSEQIPTWEDWIDYELEKRLLCGIYIGSSLNSATYAISPGFTSLRDLDIEMPAKEILWEAQTREEWRELMDAHRSERLVTVASLVHQVVFGDDSKVPNHSPTDTGAFGLTVVLHGVNVHMYSVAQSMSSLITNLVDTSIGYAVRLSHHTQTERALSRCHEFLRSWQLIHDDSVLNRHEESFIFNCQALLRLSYVRACSGLRHFNRTVLMSGDNVYISAAVNGFVIAPQSRNLFMTKAAEQVMFCFTAPIRAGHMLTRKTAAFTWSIEHAVASWDCTLFLSKWIYTVEIQGRESGVSDEENRVFGMLKEALSEADSPYDNQLSLAAQVTRTWAMFMDDVWVWEVTMRMGSILRSLADVYDSSWQRQRQRPGDSTLEHATILPFD